MAFNARNQLFRLLKSNCGVRTIMTSNPKLDKAVENLQKNPYFDKYAERIAQLQKTSPEEFLQRVERTELLKQEERKKKFAAVDTRQYSSVLNPKESLKEGTEGDEKKLEDILKIELVKDKDAAEIQAIWEQYHNHKEVICATIPLSIYSELRKQMSEHPTFLFPLPRSQGYEFIMTQISGHTVHCTPLLAFQVHKENAPECLTMVHYTELTAKGIILMRGVYDKNVINGQEAQCLANQFQMYYSGKDKPKTELLRTFTKNPDNFKHMELVAQLENITLS